MDNCKLLKLKVTSKEDLDVLSALLQDSIYKFSMCSYHEHYKKCFRMIFNRFCWENNSDGSFYRSHIGLYIHNVESISINQNILNNPNAKYLNLLTCSYSDDNNLYFIFSGDKKIRFHVNDILIYAKDLHDHWPTHNKPYHKI